MKIETVLRYAAEIAMRLESVNGLIPTPWSGHEFYLVNKAWGFGSTNIGGQSPNDLDVLLFAENAGPRQKWEIIGFDPACYKANGIRQTRHRFREGKMWLKKGLQIIRTQDTDSEVTIFDRKLEIYPRHLLA